MVISSASRAPRGLGKARHPHQYSYKAELNAKHYPNNCLLSVVVLGVGCYECTTAPSRQSFLLSILLEQEEKTTSLHSTVVVTNRKERFIQNPGLQTLDCLIQIQSSTHRHTRYLVLVCCNHETCDKLSYNPVLY